MKIRRCSSCGSLCRIGEAHEFLAEDPAAVEGHGPHEAVIVHSWPPCPLFVESDGLAFWRRHTVTSEEVARA